MQEHNKRSVVDNSEINFSPGSFTARDALQLITRIQSLEEIVAAQDEQLKAEIRDEEQIGLLEKWREKVFSLLLQEKLWTLRFSTEVPALHKEIASLKAQQSKKEQERRDVETLLIEEHSQLAQTKKDVARLSKESAEKTKVLTKVVAFADQMNENITKLQDRATTSLAVLYSRVSGLKEVINKFQESSMTQTSEQAAEVKRLSSRLEMLSQEYKEKESTIRAENEVLSGQLASLQSELGEEMRRNKACEDSLAARLQEAEVRHEALKQLYEKERSEAADKTSLLSSELQSLQETLSAKETMIAELRTSLAAVQERLSSLQLTHQQTSELNHAKIQTLESQLEKETAQFRTKEESLKQEYLRLQYAIAKMGAGMKSTAEKHREVIASLEAEHAVEKKELRGRVNTLLQQLQAVQTERDSMQESIGQLQRMVSSKTRIASTLLSSGTKQKHPSTIQKPPSSGYVPPLVNSSYPTSSSLYGHDRYNEFVDREERLNTTGESLRSRDSSQRVAELLDMTKELLDSEDED